MQVAPASAATASCAKSHPTCAERGGGSSELQLNDVDRQPLAGHSKLTRRLDRVRAWARSTAEATARAYSNVSQIARGRGSRLASGLQFLAPKENDP